MIATLSDPRDVQVFDELASHLGRDDGPIGFAAGDANLYRYVGNSPVNGSDPSGLRELQWPLNSVVHNCSGEPIWVGSPGGKFGWLDNGQDTSMDQDEGDFVYWHGKWYKTGFGIMWVGPKGPIRGTLFPPFGICFVKPETIDHHLPTPVAPGPPPIRPIKPIDGRPGTPGIGPPFELL